MYRILLLIVGLVTVSVAGCYPEHHKLAEKGKFLVTSPLRTDTEITEEYVAQIRAIQHIDIRALERGYLTDIFVDEGEQVKKGCFRRASCRTRTRG